MNEPTHDELLTACRVLIGESIGDFVYEMRERVLEDRSFTGNTWHHPRVVAYSEACSTLRRFVEANPLPPQPLPPPDPVLLGFEG